MSDVDLGSLEGVLDMLRAKGVKRAQIRGSGVVEVEFFGEAPPENVPETARGEDEGRQDGYDLAIAQLRRKKFAKPGEVES